MICGDPFEQQWDDPCNNAFLLYALMASDSGRVFVIYTTLPPFRLIFDDNKDTRRILLILQYSFTGFFWAPL